MKIWVFITFRNTCENNCKLSSHFSLSLLSLSVPVGFFLLAVILLPLISSGPARLRGGRRVIAVPAWRKGLLLAAPRLRVRVLTISLRWRGIVAVTLRLWASVVSVALGFRRRVVVWNGRECFLLDVSVCLAKAGFSLMEGAQLRHTAGWMCEN